jgi:drug/metabolite transporter (DMT)-like permease
VVAHWGVPPLYYAAVRFAVVALLTLPWLLPAPRPTWRMVLVGLLMGGGNFALLFMGFKTASPSAASVVIQVGVPFTTLLSVLILGEKIRWRRGVGIALTLAGAVVVMWSPHGLELSAGLWLIVAAAFTGSLGAVMMKQVEGVKPLQFQAWVGFSSFWPLAAMSAVMEPGQVAAGFHAGWPFVGAVAFSALVVSVVAHTAYYGLIQRSAHPDDAAVHHRHGRRGHLRPLRPADGDRRGLGAAGCSDHRASAESGHALADVAPKPRPMSLPHEP